MSELPTDAWMRYNASEYTINGKTYRNLEAQVLKNMQDIKELKETDFDDFETKDNKTQDIGPDSTAAEYPSAKAVYDDVLTYAQAIGEDVAEMSPIVARALVTPVAAPTEKTLVGVGTGREQIQVKIGDGLELEGETSPYTIKATPQGGDDIIIYDGNIDFSENALRMNTASARDIVDAVNSGKTVILMAEGAEITGHTTNYVFVVDYVDDADSASGYSFTTSVSKELKVVASGVSHDATIFNIVLDDKIYNHFVYIESGTTAPYATICFNFVSKSSESCHTLSDIYNIAVKGNDHIFPVTGYSVNGSNSGIAFYMLLTKENNTIKADVSFSKSFTQTGSDTLPSNIWINDKVVEV